MRTMFTLIMCLIYSTATGQVLLKTNLLYPAVRGASLALEVAMPEHTSLSVYGAFGSNGNLILAKTYEFQNLIIEHRMYKSSAMNRLQGVYYGPYVKYMHRRIYKEGLSIAYLVNTKGTDFDGHSIGIGGVVGTQIPNRYPRRTSFDIFGGIGYLVYVNQTNYLAAAESTFGHLDLRVGVSFCYGL